MFYNYVLKSEKTDDTYIGRTSDLKRRLSEHNKGLNSSTKRYMPWKLIYYEACLDETDNIRREGYMKTTQGRRLLQRRLKEYFYHQDKFGMDPVVKNGIKSVVSKI